MEKLTEAGIQKAILDYLHYRKIFAWRTNSGVAWQHSKDKSYPIRLAPKGTADIIGVLPNGRFLAIEVKKKGNGPTEDQFNFLLAINNTGGLAFTAYSIDDVQTQLRFHGYKV